MNAFPSVEYVQPAGVGASVMTIVGGMTLRDYFAAKAMQAILDQKDVHDGRQLPNTAWIAYQMADAMMEARK
jgi:hypothetical protein